MAGRRGAEHATNIMGALNEAERPLSAYDLLDKLRPTGVAAPLTVYRALDKLIAAGKVHRIESLNAFVACRSDGHDHGAHAHHLDQPRPRASVGFTICDGCGAVEEFVDAKLFDQLSHDLRKKNFTAHTSAIEVHGLCSACRTGEGAQTGAKHV